MRTLYPISFTMKILVHMLNQTGFFWYFCHCFVLWLESSNTDSTICWNELGELLGFFCGSVWHFFSIKQSPCVFPVFWSGKTSWKGSWRNSSVNHIFRVYAIVWSIFTTVYLLLNIKLLLSSGSILYCHIACQEWLVSVAHHLPDSYLAGYLPVILCIWGLLLSCLWNEKTLQ